MRAFGHQHPDKREQVQRYEKKIVGGRMAKNSSFSFSSNLCMAFLRSMLKGHSRENNNQRKK